MKTLNRMSLDELAKIMPVLSEEEQRQCVGGTAFYNTSGDFIADVGPGDNIRITTRDILDKLKLGSEIMGDRSYSESNSWGSPLKEAKMKPEEITKMLSHIVGEDMGAKFSEGIDYTSGSIYDALTFMYSAEGTPNTFGLRVDLAGLSVQKVSSFRSTYFHEDVHRNNYTGSSWERENIAYTQQTNQEGFTSLDESYRLQIKEGWILQYSNSPGNSGNIPESIKKFINKQCGF